MHKRLYKLIALLLLPVFLVACEHQGAENKVEPEVLAATLQKALDTANKLDNLNAKAYGMAQVAIGMASVDPVKAGQSFNEALNLAKQTRNPQYRATLAELQNTTSSWPAAEKEQVADALDRIEKAITRVWVVRDIAEGIMINDPAVGANILRGVANDALRIPDNKYRDLDLRSISAQLAKVDVAGARTVARAISDPRVRAWALIEIGKTASRENPDEAAEVLSEAAGVARSIPGIQPTSELLVEDVSDETKHAVLGEESAKITAAGARALGSAAVAMSSVDRNKARRIADDAAEMAMGIDGKKYPYTKAYAMSDVAIEVVKFDPSRAMSIIDNIDTAHPDARVSGLIAVIGAKSGSANPSNILSDISNAVKIAEGISDRYDRAKALSALAEAAIPYSKEKATDIAGEIEEELGHDEYAFSSVKDEVLADIAVAWMNEDAEMAKKILEPTPEDLAKDRGRYIVEPRFAKNSVLHTKARAYLGMADAIAASDPASAMKLYTKAAGAAADARSTRLQWEIAKRLCKSDKGKLFDYAATIEAGDFNNQALALANIAADWSAKGDPVSGMVWDMAAKAANTLGDDMESSTLLNKVAASCAGYDKDKATEIYAMSAKRISKIGMEQG